MRGEKTREIAEIMGVLQLELPTPYPIGPVYCYLILGPPCTLIDTGVDSPLSRETLLMELASIGIDIKDIERVILTHGHSDHYGMARFIQEVSGAQVMVHPRDMDKVMDRKGYYLKMTPYLKRLGVPQEHLESFVKYVFWETLYAPDLEEVHPLEEGEIIRAGDVELEVLHTPGHSPGHIVLTVKGSGGAFTGDFIFQEVTPDPIIDINAFGERTRSMPIHLRSLERFKEMKVKSYYPGHLEKKGTVKSALEGLKGRMAYKRALISQILEKGPLTPFEVLRAIYPHSREGETFVLLSEVIGRLDLLEKEGIVEVLEKKGLTYYLLRGRADD